MPTRITAVLPVHRLTPELPQVLDALVAGGPDELIIAVDGGDPDLVAAVTPVADRVVPVVPRSGPARARNLAAAEATGDVLFFVDADVVVHDDTVDRVRRLMEDEPAVDAVIGSYDDDPPQRNVLSRYKNLLNHHHHQRAKAEAETFWGACGAIRHEVFDALGGFDHETYPDPSIEDIELGYRLVDKGGTIRLDPDLQVTHLKRWTAPDLLRTDVTKRAIPWGELLLQRGGFQEDLNVDREHRAKVAMAGLAALGLVGATVRPRRGLSVAAGATAGLAYLDRDLASLFHRRGGARFAAPALGWHWFSYLYSGVAFAVALTRHLTGTSRAPRRPDREGTA